MSRTDSSAGTIGPAIAGSYPNGTAEPSMPIAAALVTRSRLVKTILSKAPRDRLRLRALRFHSLSFAAMSRRRRRRTTGRN